VSRENTQVQVRRTFERSFGAGEVIFEEGVATDARPGKLIRGPQQAPSA
jgi:hypothetical protein